MSLQLRLVILAGLVGLLFYNATQAQLTAVIIDYGLGWYQLGVPIAWGLILGALVTLIGVRIFDSWLVPLTYIAGCVITMGLTGAAAVFGAHQLAGLMLPPLQLASMGLGLYLFVYGYARFAAAKAQNNKGKADKKSAKSPQE